MSNCVIECEKLGKTFVEASNKLVILQNLNFKIKKGEQVAIMGRSGSGKTTLLQLMGGLDTPTSGKVLINNQNINELSENNQGKFRNEFLGFVYQFHHLLPEFTALENVAIPMLIGGLEPDKAKKKAQKLLKNIGLAHRLEHKPSEMSGGERQRTAFARALANDPDCILADEPTGNLDTESADHIFEIMRNLNKERETTFVIVTHDKNLAEQMDRLFYIEDGKLQEKN